MSWWMWVLVAAGVLVLLVGIALVIRGRQDDVAEDVVDEARAHRERRDNGGPVVPDPHGYRAGKSLAPPVRTARGRDGGRPASMRSAQRRDEDAAVRRRRDEDDERRRRDGQSADSGVGLFEAPDVDPRGYGSLSDWGSEPSGGAPSPTDPSPGGGGGGFGGGGDSGGSSGGSSSGGGGGGGD